MRRRLAAVAACIGLGLGGLGCGSDDERASEAPPEPVRGSFVGRVASTNAFIAVVTDGRKAIAYLCDGRLVSERLEGTVEGNRLQLASDSGVRLTATIASGAINGSVRLRGGEPLGFRAIPAQRPAGYYRSQRTSGGVPVRAGWVVLPNGEQRGAVRGDGSSCKAATTNRRDPISRSLCRDQTASQRVDPGPRGGRGPLDPCEVAAANPGDRIAQQLCLDQKAKQGGGIVIGAPELNPGDAAAQPEAPGFGDVTPVDQPVVVEEGVG